MTAAKIRKASRWATAQRFLKRARGQIKEAVNRSIRERSVKDLDKSGKISIPAKSTSEPRFRLDPASGKRGAVHPGNKEFAEGDRLKKPPQSGGAGGKDASDSGEGEDSFQFTLSRDEFLDIFFEDLELPNLVKTSLKEITNWKMKRAGVTVSGAPTNINLIRTMRNAHGRRLALGRPSTKEINELKEQLFQLERIAQPSEAQIEDKKDILTQLEEMERKRRWAPYIDPLDVRYNAFQPEPVETTAAVMFCLMDVSGSMGEREKDLAKRFYMLLYLFLQRRYEKIDVVFIRHTHHAEEVDEETFFYSRQSGGTIVSTAIEEMQRIQKERYAVRTSGTFMWRKPLTAIPRAGDAQRCVQLLTSEELLPVIQYYAYIEILDEREMDVFSDPDAGAELWRAYRSINDRALSPRPGLQGRRISYPVFRELFAKDRKEVTA